MVTYLVPTDTQRVVGNDYPLPYNHLHLGLLLGRYVPLEAIEADHSVLDSRDKEIGKVRSDWISRTLEQFSDTNSEYKRLLTSYHERWEHTTRGATKFKLSLRGRLVVGLGAKGAMEFGITLQHTTGLPYIPGSALKGLARTYALLTLASEIAHISYVVDISKEDLKSPLDEYSKSLMEYEKSILERDKEQLNGEELLYREIFGELGKMGEARFHDATVINFPKTGKLFTADIMTPHFSEYYTSPANNRKPPTDADKPSLVSFISVTEGTEFHFAVSGSKDYRQIAATWLHAALQELGVGSKTASGYGVFMKPPR